MQQAAGDCSATAWNIKPRHEGSLRNCGSNSTVTVATAACRPRNWCRSQGRKPDVQLGHAGTAHRQVTAMCPQERTRLTSAPSDLQPCIQIHLEWLQTELKVLNQASHDCLQDHATWQARTELPERSHLSRREITTLAGVVPLNWYRGKHRIWGGRVSVRTILYIATVIATRHNPVICDFYIRLCRWSKPQKVALVTAIVQAAPHLERSEPGLRFPGTPTRAYSWQGLTFDTVAEQLLENAHVSARNY